MSFGFRAALAAFVPLAAVYVTGCSDKGGTGLMWYREPPPPAAKRNSFTVGRAGRTAEFGEQGVTGEAAAGLETGYTVGRYGRSTSSVAARDVPRSIGPQWEHRISGRWQERGPRYEVYGGGVSIGTSTETSARYAVQP
jgi:hypothetical protein